jgi:hypothetical protein
VNGEKWREVEKQGNMGGRHCLCNTCYMNFVENPLRRGPKRVKVTNEEEETIPSSKLELADAIRVMAKFLYERECVKNEGPIYTFDEMRTLLEASEPDLKDFFTQLYSAARPFERNKQTMDRMEKIMGFICYLLASSNNTKINSFKFALTYYLDSVGTSNERLNTMANIGKIYQTRHQYPLIVETSSDCINSYELPSLGYKITDRHLPRGFVTSRKPDTSVLCDFIYCDQMNDVSNGNRSGMRACLS